MRDGTEAEVTVFLRLPGEDEPFPMSGLFITQGMSEHQIRSGMDMAVNLVIVRLMEKGAMKYSVRSDEFISFEKKLEQE